MIKIINCELKNNIEAFGVIHAIGTKLEIQKLNDKYFLPINGWSVPLNHSDVKELNYEGY